MNNFLLWIGGLVTICLGLLFAAPHFIDWNGYRGVIEEEASRYLGRRVRIGGEVNVRVLPVPYVSFDKLSIADTSGPSSGPIIRADNFKMWLSVPPMLQGVLEAHHVELRRPVFELVINDSGGGNWQSLQLKSRAMSYLPGGFALEAMDVINGEVHVRNLSGKELTRLEEINGTLSATAIEGPYKFNGRFKWYEETRDLRLATARPATNGDIRLKASISDPNASRRTRGTVLEGTLSTENGKTKFAGNVSATLSGFRPAAAPSAGAKKAGDAKLRTSTFDLKSQLAIDTTTVKLNGINLALVTDGPPQLMTGDASLAWTDDVALDVDLSSRWIDFDRFTVSGSDAPPLDNARQLLVALGRALPKTGKTNVRIAFDQATLGREALGTIALVAVRETGPLKLKEFEASVPGGGKLSLAGELSVSKKVPGFRGHVSAEGLSLLKFLRWGLRDDTFAKDLQDGPYAIDGQLSLAETSFSISDADVDFGGTPLKSDLSVEFGAKPAIALRLDGHTIDWRRFSPRDLNIGIAHALMDGAEHSSAETQVSSDQAVVTAQTQTNVIAKLAHDADLRLTVKAANLVDGDNTFRDFDGTIVVRSGKISVPALQFSKDSGFNLNLEAAAISPGNAKETENNHAAIKGVVEVNSRLAMLDLLDFLDARDLEPNLRNRLSALTPLRVAHVIDFQDGDQAKTTMRFDGVSRGGHLVADIEFVDGLRTWREAPLRLSASVENRSVYQILALLSDSRIFSRAGATVEQPGQLYVKADGTPKTGILTRAVIESEGFNVDYYGDVTLITGRPFAFDGQLNFESRNLQQAMAIAGVELGDGVRELPIKGRFKVVRKDATLRLKADQVVINDSLVSGLISLTEQNNAPVKLIADLNVDQASLPGVMRAVLAPPKIKATQRSPSQTNTPEGTVDLVQKVAATPDQSTPQLTQTQSIWPKQHFDLSPLTNVEGYVTATFDSFSFAADGRLPLSNVRLEASVAPGKVSVTKLTGAALGGRTDVAFDIKKAPAGVDLNGTLKMQVGQVSASKNGGGSNAGRDDDRKDAEKYAAVFDLNYEGRAFAPQGLAADLDGKGNLVLANASLTGLTAKEVRATVDDAMQAEGPVESDVFVASLREKLKQGQINLGSLEIPVVLKDGAVTMSTINLESAHGKTSFDASLEIATMQFDSEWKIAARDPVAKKDDRSDKSRLPAVTATYVGDLGSLATVEPRLSTGALEREIAVRKMERDVAELERLRKLDEARAKEEEERRRALEARLAEQRRLQAERERQLLLQQQQGGDPNQALDPNAVIPGDPNLQDPNAAPVAKAPEQPPRRKRRVRKPPPKKDVWNPFQITPY